jgi:5-methylcytosine-specific restriction endonuclease McrA
MPQIPCIDCATLTTATRCDTCRRARGRNQERTRGARPTYRRKYADPVYKANRRALLASSTHCTICNTPPFPGTQLEVDHIKPLSDGGGNELTNLRVVCRPCNNGLRTGRIPQPPPDPHTALHMRF